MNRLKEQTFSLPEIRSISSPVEEDSIRDSLSKWIHMQVGPLHIFVCLECAVFAFF